MDKLILLNYKKEVKYLQIEMQKLSIKSKQL